MTETSPTTSASDDLIAEYVAYIHLELVVFVVERILWMFLESHAQQNTERQHYHIIQMYKDAK